MNVEFVRELNGNYLLLDADLSGPEYERKMLQYGRPPGFLPFRQHPGKEKCRYSYEISGTQSLSSMTQMAQIEESCIREIIRGIYRCCEEAELYLLRSDGICLDPGLIFRGKQGWSFVYHPDRREDIFRQLQQLSRFFLRKCNHEDIKTSRIAYELFRLCHEDNTSFTQIFGLWDDLEEEKASPESADMVHEKVRKSIWQRFRRG